MAAELASVNPSLVGPMLVIFFAFLMVIIFVSIIVYVYSGFAYMAIAKRAKLPTPGLAWIPVIGPTLIAFQTAKMPWWPWLLLAGFVLPVLSILCAIVFAVYSTIWSWKMFERVGRPGWWAILCLLPIVNLVMIGIAAWGKK